MRLSILGLLACIAISFTACEKSAVLTPDVLEGSSAAKLSTLIDDNEDRAKRGNCLTFSGDVTYLLPDGTSVTGERSVVKTEVKAWYEANPDSEEKATLQFPVDIINADETVSTLNSQEELMAAKAACKGDKGGKGKGGKGKGDSHGQKCFEFSGEVTYLLPDGKSVTGERSAVKTEVKAWYEANPDSEEKATLQFPVDIINADETISTITNREELTAAKEACKQDGRSGKKGGTKGKSNGRSCFDFSGEVTYLLPDGTSVTGEQSMVKTEVKAWYEANPDSEEKATLQFPVNIINADETVSTLNSQEELMEAKAACKGNNDGRGNGNSRGERCFEISGEVTYLLPDGTSVTGERSIVKTEVKAWHKANPDSEEKATLQFPVELVFEDESVQMINSEEELKAALESCRG